MSQGSIRTWANLVGKRMFTDKQIEDGCEREDLSIRKKRKMTDADSCIANFVFMQGTTSVTESYRNALNFIKAGDKKKPMVLFVICIQNWSSYGFTGFRCNSLQFGAHPVEKEILLMEGTPMTVMGVKNVWIDNGKSDHLYWNELNGNNLTVVYLFNSI